MLVSEPAGVVRLARVADFTKGHACLPEAAMPFRPELLDLYGLGDSEIWRHCGRAPRLESATVLRRLRSGRGGLAVIPAPCDHARWTQQIGLM